MHVHSFLSAIALSSFYLLSNAASVDLAQRDDLTITTNLPTTWGYLGCFNDSVYTRDLAPGRYFDDAAMTQEKCMQQCISAGYWFAGVEFGKECYCGYLLRSYGGAQAVKQPESKCNMACAGDAKEKCGGKDAITIFAKNQPPPITNPGANGFQSVGCKYDAGGTYRTLTTPMTVPGGPDAMTVAKCTAACGAAGYKYAGVEYASECYCGNSLTQGDDSPTPSPYNDDCDLPCKGNQSEWCGGPNFLNMYKNMNIGTPNQPSKLPPGWYYQNCYTDDTKARTLQKLLDLPTSTMTVETCVKACANKNYVFAGLEFGQECWCGNSIGNNGAENFYGCNMECRGNPTDICGGQGRLSLYHLASPNAKNIARNGYLENGGLNDWAFEYSYEGVDDWNFVLESDTGHSISGRNNLKMYPIGPSNATHRGLCFTQYYSPMEDGYYNITFFIGRSHTPSGQPGGETYDAINYETGFAYYNPAQKEICSPPSSCPYKSVGGSTQIGYEKVQYFLPGGGASRKFQICAHYNNKSHDNEDTVLIDDVTIFGPL